MTNPLGLIAEPRTSCPLSPTCKRGAIRENHLKVKVNQSLVEAR